MGTELTSSRPSGQGRKERIRGRNILLGSMSGGCAILGEVGESCSRIPSRRQERALPSQSHGSSMCGCVTREIKSWGTE